MKEAIFHPEARAEMRESVEFYGVEIHWYEAHGIGKVKFKIKQFLD